MDAHNAPPDKFKIVYLTIIMHGIGILMPWNMFINAIEYFVNYKLSEDYLGFAFPYAPNFMQYLTFSSQVPNVLFTWLNIFVRIGGDINKRIVYGITTGIILFVITIILAIVDTSSFGHGFFWLTMITVVLLNIANAIYQNTLFGMVAKLPPKYTGGIILGNNISGSFVSIVNLVSSVSTSNLRLAAIYYFITALFVLLVCLDAYFALPLNKFYRYYDLKEKISIRQQKEEHMGVQERPPYWYVFKKSSLQQYNAFFAFFITLAIFPAMHADIRPNDPDFLIPEKYFTSVTCFVTFNVVTMTACLLPSYVPWPPPKYLWIPITLRALYIPFFLFSNYQVKNVERVLPVLITNDWIYWIVSSTMAFTLGHFGTLAMMYAPGMVEEKYAPVAGMFAGASLISGIFFGIILSFAWPLIIGHQKTDT